MLRIMGDRSFFEPCHSGVVYYYVHLACDGGERPPILLLRNVQAQEFATQLRRKRADGVLILVGQDESSAFPAEGFGDGAADAACGTGDYAGLSAEFGHVLNAPFVGCGIRIEGRAR